MAVSNVGDTGPSAALLAAMNGTAATTKDTAADAQNRFMTLLVTQMKNQDPLNPMDNAQVTSQLAQLSTVTGIDKMNETLNTLMGSYQTGANLQATSLIGHGVMAAGNTMTLKDSQALLGVEVTEPADKVTVSIKDASGNLVRTIDMGSQDIGVVPLAWDGMNDKGVAAPDGKYTFDVAATRGTDKAKVNPMAITEVTSVSTSSTGVKVNLLGGASIALADVKQII